MPFIFKWKVLAFKICFLKVHLALRSDHNAPSAENTRSCSSSFRIQTFFPWNRKHKTNKPSPWQTQEACVLLPSLPFLSLPYPTPTKPPQWGFVSSHSGPFLLPNPCVRRTPSLCFLCCCSESSPKGIAFSLFHISFFTSDSSFFYPPGYFVLVLAYPRKPASLAISSGITLDGSDAVVEREKATPPSGYIPG